MGSRLPNARPQMTREQAEKIIAFYKIDREKFPVCVVAVRGYYLDSMGEKGKNDRGIFDDAAAVVSPNVFVTVNWNTDASSYRKGTGRGAEKGMAMLAEGVWDYQIGAHKGRSPAGVQAGDVTVMRDGNQGSYPDVGRFGINLHWGSASGGTSSLGCQTAPPDQFPTFITPIVTELKRYGKKVFKYILISEAARRQILNPPENTVGEVAAPAPKPVDNKVYLLDSARDLVKEFEGCVLEAYKDPVGIWTIGYGSTHYPDGSPVRKGDKISKARAEQLLSWELAVTGDRLEKMISVPVTNHEFSALVSFAYNVGVGGPDARIAGFYDSTMRKKLNAGAPKIEVADEFLKWVKAGGRVLNGLVRRRKAERNLFLTEDITTLS